MGRWHTSESRSLVCAFFFACKHGSDTDTWDRLEIAGTPVKLKSTTALGAFVPHSFTQFFRKLGFDPSKWF
jgi:hypothetical protein